MKVGVRCCFIVSRPPVKFHRNRSSFDAPTDNYSDIIVGLYVGRFRSPETAVGLLSLLSSQLIALCPAHLQSIKSPSARSRTIAIRGSENGLKPTKP